MNGNMTLFNWILFGDFGLLTLTPRYLFGVLFPIMIFLGCFRSLLGNRQEGQLFYIITGLGCTTAALAALETMSDQRLRRYILWLLILLVPCSSQIAIIAAFAAIVTLRVFAAYAMFTLLILAVLYGLLTKVYPPVSSSCPCWHESALPPKGKKFPLTTAATKAIAIVKASFLSVASTIPSFCLGGVVISTLMYLGVLDSLGKICSPWMQAFLHLPADAVSLFMVNLFKRDFGSASLLAFAEQGSFDGIQLVVIMVMLTFTVPCFNSTILLLKQEKLPIASLIWMGSLCISLLCGRLVSTVLFVCAI